MRRTPSYDALKDELGLGTLSKNPASASSFVVLPNGIYVTSDDVIPLPPLPLPPPAALPPPAPPPPAPPPYLVNYPPVASYAPGYADGVAPRVELPTRPRMGHPRVAPRVAPIRSRMGHPRVAPRVVRVVPTRPRMGHPRIPTRGLTSHIEYLDEDALEDPELQQALGMSAAAASPSSYAPPRLDLDELDYYARAEHARAKPRRKAPAVETAVEAPTAKRGRSTQTAKRVQNDAKAAQNTGQPSHRELRDFLGRGKEDEFKTEGGNLYKTMNRRMRRSRRAIRSRRARRARKTRRARK